jgi:hypothetical protein
VDTRERESSYSYLVTIPALTCLQERKGWDEHSS